MLAHFRSLAAIALSLALSAATPAQAPASGNESLTVDAHAPTTPFPHFWEQTFGSGRAILSLRESYRSDLRAVKAITGFESVRFHAIFLEDVGMYDPDRKAILFAQMKSDGTSTQAAAGPYNFSYVDQIYDGLLANHVRPFVELSFMPKKMAAKPDALHPFWYKQNVGPPSDYALWDAMITAFAQHLIQRYGIGEVSQWYFEVWNEPNIDFWAGTPKQPTYFELYDHTARAIKAASPRLRIGGPATAQAAWVGDFLAHCKAAAVPCDFASTHVYANDTAPDVFHTQEVIPRDKMVALAVRKVHEEILHSPLPQTPLFFSEYNASYANEPNVTDSTYMGPWLATTISQVDGLVQSMAYWSFSDVFEEQGVVRTPFYGGFGLLAEDNIPKPSFNAFALLHRLGDRRIALQSGSALATTDSTGALTIALWNYAPPDGTGAAYTPPPATHAPDRTFTVTLKGVAPNASVELLRVDDTHGNVIPTFDRMGRPATPSREQIQQLQAAGAAAPAEHLRLSGSTLTVTVPAHGLALIRVASTRAAGASR